MLVTNAGLVLYLYLQFSLAVLALDLAVKQQSYHLRDVQNIAMRNMFKVDVVQKENCAFRIVDGSCRALILGGP